MQETERFKNRLEAGSRLAQRLSVYAGRAEAIVLALPRGGVPVGFVIAQALGIPLDVMLVRKLGAPGNEELAMGAIASGGVCVLQSEVLQYLDIPMKEIEATILRKRKELDQREKQYRANRPAPQLAGRLAILVDDGLATGATMLAAVKGARQANVARLIVAVPVAAADSIGQVQSQADEFVSLTRPEPFYSVGQWYDDFSQTSDAEVVALLDKAARRK